MDGQAGTHSHHVVPLRVYLAVGGALFILTIVTIAVSLVPLGGWNVVVALGVASIKASLVALIFMHLLYDKKIFLIIFVAAIVFLAVFIIFTLFDTLHRDSIDDITAQPIRKDAVIYDSTPAGPADTSGRMPEGRH